jgi:diguanylate cyclase (GGDEF)-like protein
MKIFLYLLLFVSSIFAQTSKSIELSSDEAAYLKEAKSITMCVDPDWEPFEQIKDGRHIGISADLIQLISSRLNVNVKLIPTTTWEESIAFSKSGKCDILSFLNKTPKRDEWLLFTEPIFKDPNVLVGRADAGYIEDISKIKASIVLPKQTAMGERFGKDFPNLLIIPVDSEAQVFKLVEDRKADMTLRSMIVTAYTIKKEGLFNLKIIGQPAGYENILRIGVVKNRPVIRDILNKGIATITQEDTDKIINKHVVIVVEKVNFITPKMWLFVSLAVIAVALFFAILYYRRRFVASSESANIDGLTGLLNRKKFDADFQKLFSNKSSRQKLSLILFDIDDFKKINDTYGHDTGDIVIKHISDTAKNTLRQTNLIYRWGGEEFLVILESEDMESLVKIADKIRANIADNMVGNIEQVTCSFGVALFEGDDMMISLFKKADDNLYKAKRNGKNRVEF